MKKRLFSVIILLMVAVVFCTAAFADGHDPRFVDGAGLLSETEATALTGLLDQLSEKNQCEIVVVTTYGHDSASVWDAANDYYDSHNYGYNSTKDGVLLLLDMENREYAVSTTGRAYEYIKDEGLEVIMGQVVPYLSNGDYAYAFSTFAGECDRYIVRGDSGDPYSREDFDGYDFDPYDYNNGNRENQDTSLNSGDKVAIGAVSALGIGSAVGGISVGSMKSKLKSVRSNSYAANYVKNNSMTLTENRDTYLYSTVIRTEIPRNTGSSSGGHMGSSGGFTSHSGFGSSGTFHGGGSGKF